jgi:hypothetical protein
MKKIRNWAAGWVIAALVLFSLAVASPTIIAADTLIDPLGEVEALAFLYLFPAVLIVWILFRRAS